MGNAIRVEFFGDEIDRISEINVITGEIILVLQHYAIYPATHYIVDKAKMLSAIDNIKSSLRNVFSISKIMECLLRHRGFLKERCTI